MEYIWESVLASKYKCTVTRINKRGGHLTVVEEATNRVLLAQDIGLLNGAKSGADSADITKWQDICNAVINRDAKRLTIP